MRIAGAGLTGASLPLIAGCGNTTASVAAEGDKWKQFSGTTLNFISENTSPMLAIAANLDPFRDLTGITVNITRLEVTGVAQRAALDLASGQAQYPVIYADPWQIMAPLHSGFMDLNEFINDDSLPSLPKDVGDFVAVQLEVAGRFGGRDGDLRAGEAVPRRTQAGGRGDAVAGDEGSAEGARPARGGRGSALRHRRRPHKATRPLPGNGIVTED